MAMVCLCHGVSERKVNRAIDRGASSVQAVSETCGAGSCCFGCHPTIEDLIAERVAVRPRLGPAVA